VPLLCAQDVEVRFSTRPTRAISVKDLRICTTLCGFCVVAPCLLQLPRLLMGRQPEEYGCCNRQIRHLRGELPLIAWHQMAVRSGERACVESITRIRCRIVNQIRSPAPDRCCEYLAGLIEIVALRRIGRSLQRREKEFVHYHERLFGKQKK
jgi:hypothetical protein